MIIDKKPPSSHVAFLLPNLGGGGAERVIVQLANGFSERGLKVDVLLFQKIGVLLPEVSHHVNLIDMNARNMYLALPKLISYLRDVKPDVLLSTLEFTSLMVLLARRLSGVKTRIIVRVSVAISRHKRSRLKKIIERHLVAFMYPWSDRIVSVSRDTAQDLIDFAGISPGHIQTIYNPVVSDDLLTQADAPVLHPFYQPGEPPVIVGVGRLTEQKDFPTLIRAFEIIRKQRPVHLLILGDGDDRSKLERLLVSLGLEQDVALPGFTSNPFAYMRKSAVFVLSSRWEGLPNALIQALACGCPAVSTNCPTGPLEILDGGKYGHLVPVGDPHALAKAILQSLQGDYRNPPAIWLEQFRVEAVIQQYLNMMGLVEETTTNKPS